ncbi:hypothetical protein LCGC14_1752530 [marine sediment metagenome]|uniref:DNA methylase N-4/N-6 domain-containing protein n=1 Tax=marine sediment metagenome TaxID=412755 RepID=A0A0F9H3F2_9ZZZZ
MLKGTGLRASSIPGTSICALNAAFDHLREERTLKMSNIYLERFEERVDQYGLDGVAFNTNDIAILALVKEVQTLNETLKEIRCEITFYVARTEKGNTILDPFTGSSTTGLAAYFYDRNFVLNDVTKIIDRHDYEDRRQKAANVSQCKYHT